MKTLHFAWRRRAWRPGIVLGSLIGLLAIETAWGAAAPFGVPVRLSFKFFLNAAGNRPPGGDLNTDAGIEAQVARGNQILSAWTSELRLHLVEIADVAGHSEWYDASTDDRDDIRAAALADPSGYAWRNNAVNIYIVYNYGCSARSKLPPDNDIIIVCQSIYDTTVAHEVGHSLNLYHTHETAGADGGDECSDTSKDNEDWTRDQIATNAYDKVYALLDATQKYNVDMVWSNLMSYHNGDHRWMMSSCQMDRASTQASSDQTWLLSKRPIYVDAANVGVQNGTFPLPYQNIRNAINSGLLNNRVLVVDQGTHANPSSAITTATDVVPRKGAATIRDYKLPYDLPGKLDESPNLNMHAAILRAQLADRQKDIDGVITNLLEAEKHATNRERDAIRLELAQRYRDSQRFEEAGVWFQKVADEADQPGLRKRSREKAASAKVEAERLKKPKEKRERDAENDNNPKP